MDDITAQTLCMDMQVTHGASAGEALAESLWNKELITWSLFAHIMAVLRQA